MRAPPPEPVASSIPQLSLFCREHRTRSVRPVTRVRPRQPSRVPAESCPHLHGRVGLGTHESMPREPLQPPIFVDTAHDLDRMLTDLSGVEAVAIDCEMNAFYSYTGRVCLIQVGDAAREWIVDPLAVDVRPMGALFADPGESPRFPAPSTQS